MHSLDAALAVSKARLEVLRIEMKEVLAPSLAISLPADFAPTTPEASVAVEVDSVEGGRLQIARLILAAHEEMNYLAEEYDVPFEPDDYMIDFLAELSLIASRSACLEETWPTTEEPPA